MKKLYQWKTVWNIGQCNQYKMERKKNGKESSIITQVKILVKGQTPAGEDSISQTARGGPIHETEGLKRKRDGKGKSIGYCGSLMWEADRRRLDGASTPTRDRDRRKTRKSDLVPRWGASWKKQTCAKAAGFKPRLWTKILKGWGNILPEGNVSQKWYMINLIYIIVYDILYLIYSI